MQFADGAVFFIARLHLFHRWPDPTEQFIELRLVERETGIRHPLLDASDEIGGDIRGNVSGLRGLAFRQRGARQLGREIEGDVGG